MLALAGCGSDSSSKADASIKLIDAPPDSKVWMDAPPGPDYDFTCMSNSAPTTAAANITLSGSVQEVGFDFTQNPPLTLTSLENASTEACKAGVSPCTGQDKYGMASTDAAGAFSIGPIATSSMPLDTYIAMTSNGARSVFVYPPQPFVADQTNIPVISYADSMLGLLAQVPGGCTQDDATKGLLTLAVTDCASTPIGDSANLTISVKQNNAEVQGITVVDLGGLSQMAAGTYVVCNVPEDATTTVGATYKTMALRAHDVKVVKGTTTATILRPGY